MIDTHPTPTPPTRTEDGTANRRAVLVASGVAVAAAACAPRPTAPAPPTTTTATVPTTAAPTTAPPPTTMPSTPTPPGAATLTARVAVDKLTFGPTPGLLAAVEARGVWNWIEDQLDPVGRGVPDAEARLAGYSTLTNTHRQNYDVQDSDDGWERLIAELDHGTVQRAVYSQRQLLEVMCDFWANHFNTWRQKTWMLFLKSRSNERVVRAHALGRFADLLSASAHDTAMLDYLDNLPSDASQPGGVNENYARELMELHSLGIVNGVQTHTEADVAGVARVMSGWSINWDDDANRYDFEFLPWQHSREAVSVLGGAFSRPQRSYGQGYADGVRLLDVLAHHPATARHIAFKLCRRFVNDAPSDALVASTAAVFTANDTAIVPTLRHIFSSAEFAGSHRAKVRRPVDHVVGSLRALGASLPTEPMTQATVKVRDVLDRIGQPMFERPSPDGYPDVAGYWASSEAFLQRWAFAGRLARNRLTDPTADGAITVDLRALVPAAPPGTVADLVRSLAAEITNVDISATDVGDLCAAASIAPTAAASTVAADLSKVANLLGLLLCHPTFQRR